MKVTFENHFCGGVNFRKLLSKVDWKGNLTFESNFRKLGPDRNQLSKVIFVAEQLLEKVTFGRPEKLEKVIGKFRKN